jgi:hypothetical protein
MTADGRGEGAAPERHGRREEDECQEGAFVGGSLSRFTESGRGEGAAPTPIW